MKRLKLLTIVSLISIVTLAGCNYSTNKTNEYKEEKSINNEVQQEIKKEEKPSHTSITFTGDILMHMPMVSSVNKDNRYDFDNLFTEVKDKMTSTDFVVADMETTINPKCNLSGYPAFNSPVTILDTLKKLKVNALINAHNHILDTGLDGVKSTLKYDKEYGIQSIGAGLPEDNKYAIFEKDNIKIGVLGYTYSTNFGNKDDEYINYIDKDKIKKDMDLLKNDKKCDFIIVYYHIGTEYVRNIEKDQQDIVNYTANLGADAILCSHPHVPKKSEIIKANGKDVYVNYAMGNFISNQNDKYTDMGTLVQLNIEKKDNKAYLSSGQSYPIYRLRYNNNNKTIYKTVPIENIDKYNNILSKEAISYIKDTAKEIEFTYKNNN